MRPPELTIGLPEWIPSLVDWERSYASREERMTLTIELARENVVRGSGGPFGAAIFEQASGRLLSVGVNSVVRLNNCTLHAEMVAFMMAQASLGSFTLAGEGAPACELVTSCEPCAMCLGAALWSGVRGIVCGAHREDAHRLGFDEGPVFAQSHRYLAARGVPLVRGILRAEADAVFDLYAALQGRIYNGTAPAVPLAVSA